MAVVAERLPVVAPVAGRAARARLLGGRGGRTVLPVPSPRQQPGNRHLPAVAVPVAAQPLGGRLCVLHGLAAGEPGGPVDAAARNRRGAPAHGRPRRVRGGVRVVPALGRGAGPAAAGFRRGIHRPAVGSLLPYIRLRPCPLAAVPLRLPVPGDSAELHRQHDGAAADVRHGGFRRAAQRLRPARDAGRSRPVFRGGQFLRLQRRARMQRTALAAGDDGADGFLRLVQPEDAGQEVDPVPLRRARRHPGQRLPHHPRGGGRRLLRAGNGDGPVARLFGLSDFPDRHRVDAGARPSPQPGLPLLSGRASS